MACPPLQSNVNLSRIVRAASCCAVGRLIACGTPHVEAKIARDGASELEIEVRRTLVPVLKKLRADGYQLVGLEQTSHSQCIYSFAFERRTVLVVGHERTGIGAEVLRMLDAVIEIPVYGKPYSHNVATATSMALYEFCRQFPA